MKSKNLILQTVVETPEFIKQAKESMDDDMRESFIDYIAKNPLEGDLIQGTGGARKMRWQSTAKTGKRGGVRVIYYYHDEEIPIFLFTVYKKNQQENIASSEKAALKKIIKSISELYKGGH